MTTQVQPAGSIYVSGEYATTNANYHVDDSAWKARQILDILGKNRLAPKSVCEVGCGAGEILRQLQQAMGGTGAFHGFDISPQAIDLTKARANPGLEFFCADFLTAPTQKYDLLLGMDVVEHVDDYIGFLRGLVHRAEYKVFHFPLDVSVQSVLRKNFIPSKRAQLGHLHYFTKDTVLATVSYAGYEIVDWMYTPSDTYRTQSLLSGLAKYPRILGYKLAPDFVVRLLGGYSLLVLAK